MHRCHILLLCALALTGCQRSQSRARPVVSTAASAALGTTSVAPERTGDAAAKSAPVGSGWQQDAGTAPPPAAGATTADRVHCKALGKRGQIQLGPIRETLVDMVLERDGVFAFTYHQPLARVSLLQYLRDGTPAVVIGRHTSPGDPRSPKLTSGAAYFVRNKVVYRMPREGGSTTELAKGVSGAIAVQGEYLYGFECDPKKTPDQLLRISTRDGSVERFAPVERANPKEQDGTGLPCDYSSLIADEKAVYAANLYSRQIIRIALGDRAVTTLATKKTYLRGLTFYEGSILFQAAGGLYEVSQTEANATRISEIGSAPFSYVAHHGPTTYIHRGEPYMPEEWTYKLVRTTGKLDKFQHYQAMNPGDTPPDTGIRGIAVDDECVYTARLIKTTFSLFARSRQ